MYPGLELEKPQNTGEMASQLEVDLDSSPSRESLAGVFHEYVEDGGYSIEDVLYAVASSEEVFPEVDENAPARVERSHDHPGEDATAVMINGERKPFSEYIEELEENNFYRRHVAEFDETSYGEGEGRPQIRHKYRVPENVRNLRFQVSSSLMDFVKEASEEYSTIIDRQSTLRSDEEFGKVAWKEFQNRYDIDNLEKHDMEEAIRTWESTSADDIRETLIEDPDFRDLTEFNRELLRDLYGENTEIPLRRTFSLDPETEDELKEDSTLYQERPLPDSWGFKDLAFYRRAEDYGLGIDIRNSVSVDDVVLSPHLLNGIMERERGEWIVNDDKEEFGSDEYRLVQKPEAEFYEPEMMWTYEKLKEGNIA